MMRKLPHSVLVQDDDLRGAEVKHRVALGVSRSQPSRFQSLTVIGRRRPTERFALIAPFSIVTGRVLPGCW